MRIELLSLMIFLGVSADEQGSHAPSYDIEDILQGVSSEAPAFAYLFLAEGHDPESLEAIAIQQSPSEQVEAVLLEAGG